MVCLGLEPGVAGWKAQTNPLSYSGTPFSSLSYSMVNGLIVTCTCSHFSLFLNVQLSVNGLTLSLSLSV